MTDQDDIILDQPEHEKPPQERWKFIVYLAVAIFIAGVVGLIFRHPAAPLLMAAGLALSHIRSTLYFVGKEKFDRIAIAFFVGRTLLVTCFVLWLLNMRLSLWLVGLTSLAFIVAIIFSWNTKDGELGDELD